MLFSLTEPTRHKPTHSPVVLLEGKSCITYTVFFVSEQPSPFYGAFAAFC